MFADMVLHSINLRKRLQRSYSRRSCQSRRLGVRIAPIDQRKAEAVSLWSAARVRFEKVEKSSAGERQVCARRYQFSP